MYQVPGIRYTAILLESQCECGTSSDPFFPMLRLRLYPPAFVADSSRSMRLRSISSLPIGSIPSIGPSSTVAARLRAHAVPNGLGADSKFRLEREWVTCGHCVVLLTLPSLEHFFKFRIDYSIGRTHIRVLVITCMLARDCMNARSQLHVCPLACSRRTVDVAAAVRSG